MVRGEEVLIGVEGVLQKCTANACPESVSDKNEDQDLHGWIVEHGNESKENSSEF